MRVFSTVRALGALLFLGAVAAKPFERLLQTNTAATMLDAMPISPDLAYINKAINGDLGNWNFLDDIAKSSGFGELLKHPTALKSLLANDQFKTMSVLPSFNKLITDVNKGTVTDQALPNLFSDALKEMIMTSKAILEVARDPSKVADAVSGVALSEDDAEADAYFAAQGGDATAFDTVAKAVSKSLHPAVNMDMLKELGMKQSLDKVLAMDEVMHVVDNDPHMAKVLRAISPQAMIDMGKAVAAGAEFRW